MKWRPSFLLIVALLLGSACAGSDDPSPAAFGDQRSDSCEKKRLRTFAVAVEADRASYSIGETVTLEITVVRSPGEASDSEPPAYSDALPPVEGAKVVVSASMRDAVLGGTGVTDKDGTVEIGLQTARYARAGAANVSTYTWKPVGPECSQVAEDGHVYSERLFRLRK